MSKIGEDGVIIVLFAFCATLIVFMVAAICRPELLTQLVAAM